MTKILLLILSVSISFAGLAQSKDDNYDASVVIYKIKTGDTLSKVASKYFENPSDTAAIFKYNQFKNADSIPVGTALVLPRQLIKTSPSKASVMSLSCANTIRVSPASKPLAIGAVIKEGAVIEVPPDCYVSLLLEDGSIIRLPSSAVLKITTLRKNNIESAPEVRLDLMRGRIELDVYKGRTKTTPFEIHTPLSIMGVRGTEFRVGYSPDDNASQVEVLGGIVQTRGTADSQTRMITKGLGVPIDKEGKALGTEKLLDPPRVESVVATAGSQPSFVIQLSTIPLANYYVADSASTANLTGNRSTQQLLTPELFIPRVTKQAIFYQLTSVSTSDLVGTERHYAFCADPNDGKPARCSAMFDAPLADGIPISVHLSRVVDGVRETLVNTQNLQARHGRFAIQGLPAGHYEWVMSYAATDPSKSLNNNTVIRQAGTFELIPLPISHKP
jgi:hypothetical protein